MDTITLAAATGVKDGIRNNVVKIAGWITQNQSVATLLAILGGLLLLASAGVFLYSKVRPMSQITQQINTHMGGLICAAILGAVLIAPAGVASLIGTVIGTLVEFVMNVLSYVFPN